MATIKQLGSNKMEMFLGNGTVVLYSYNTPVAIKTEDGKYRRTVTKHSVTTSKHINAWLKAQGATSVGVMSQEEINKKAAISAINP